MKKVTAVVVVCAGILAGCLGTQGVVLKSEQTLKQEEQLKKEEAMRNEERIKNDAIRN